MTARSSPAALRNREVIAQTLAPFMPPSGTALMIAEGSGEHAVHFAAAFPEVTWQPTDPDEEARASIAAYRASAGLPNLSAPLPLDAAAGEWPIDRADLITCINMVHISPWAATEGLMRGAGRTLPTGGVLYLYGPYRRGSRPIEPSNAVFDESLKARDPRWCLRELQDVIDLADAHGLRLQLVEEMPANNLSVIFRRR